ncbi:hypothetical protein [Actinomadura opuntiae]|uniref:hypothetical protein n=1 Tax=Actinomadura sp. OS1-43 TaxID=604315 RepID=UPI00255AC757|nr:hypothetical protein [Actinomadura sp. OS1-43]MDL4818306.1 hypothetical protein [Actinomadura sp. OS1-43]
MRKIAITGMTAALALGLTACGGNGDGHGNSVAAPPSSPTASASVPGGTATPSGASTPAPASTPNGASTPGDPGAPTVRHTPATGQGGQQIRTKWGKLRYMAPGKYIVGNVAFFTANDTVVYVAGGTCPDGSTPPDDSKCSIDGLDEWAQAAPHNVSVRFSGQAATTITETQ